MRDAVKNGDFISTLRLCPTFQGLADDAVSRLLALASVRNFSLGDQIFLQGDLVDYIYVVISGWVKIYRLTQAGDEAVIAVCTRGDSFAEAAAFMNGSYLASSTAVTDGKVMRLSSTGLKSLVSRDPEIGLAMLRSSSQYIHMLVRQIEHLKAHTGAQRLATFLLSLTDRRSGSCILDLPYEKGLIAARLGMKPESLSRAFQKLRLYGVTVKKKHTMINELTALVEMTKQERAVVMNKRS